LNALSQSLEGNWQKIQEEGLLPDMAKTTDASEQFRRLEKRTERLTELIKQLTVATRNLSNSDGEVNLRVSE
tara:strand:+ start:8962 stop:9177 length:216 start_codon:yes stop_codon:yes gene_type:complete